MKKLLVLLAGCLMSMAAFATDDPGQGANSIDQTAAIDRFRELERMDVTSEREPADPSEIEPISQELDAILDQAEALDTTD